MGARARTDGSEIPAEPGRLSLIIAAGGRGLRLGADGPKQYVELRGIPMVQRTIAALDSCSAVDRIVVVVNPEDKAFCEREIVADRFAKVVGVVGGGSHRALSVRNGLAALADHGPTEYVGVHDGARPLIRCEDVARARARLASAATLAGVVLAVPSTDTIKRVDAKGLIVETPARDHLWQAQTPQVFRWAYLARAYAQPESALREATDDAALVEAIGGRVVVVEGSHENLKVTHPDDIPIAERILERRRR